MSSVRIFVLTLLAMLAFAGNSVLCRIALKQTDIDAASFTSIRLISGALVLCVIAAFCCRGRPGKGSWLSGFALFVYAAGFSFAYMSLTAATGALLLFGAVQVTMIAYGLMSGERMTRQEVLGLVLALLGLFGLLFPGLSAPPLFGSVLMMLAGVAWGVYSLLGKAGGDPTRVSAGNFIRAGIFSALLSLLLISNSELDSLGICYAIASGALASGLGYALWYSILPVLKATTAASVQLSVPVIAALGGIVILGESVTMRFLLASLAILGGIALILMSKSERLDI